MPTDRIYGDFQTAGVKVTTAAKSNVNNAGTDAYALLTGALGADGLTLASAANPGAVSNTIPGVTPTSAAYDSTGAAKAPVYTFLGHQLGLAIDTSTGLTVPGGARYAQIQCRAQIARYRYDGSTTAPTASSGMTLGVGGELALDSALSTIRFISQTAGALLDIAYFS